MKESLCIKSNDDVNKEVNKEIVLLFLRHLVGLLFDIVDVSEKRVRDRVLK